MTHKVDALLTVPIISLFHVYIQPFWLLEIDRKFDQILHMIIESLRVTEDGDNSKKNGEGTKHVSPYFLHVSPYFLNSNHNPWNVNNTHVQLKGDKYDE